MRSLVLAAACAALLVFAAGCGSSDDASQTAATPTAQPTTPFPTKTGTATTGTGTTTGAGTTAAAAHTAFLEKVDPICADYNDDVKSVQADLQAQLQAAGGKSGNVDIYVGPLKRATAAAQRASDRFAALKPPTAEAQEAELIGRALKAQAKGNDLLLKAARKDDPVEFGVANEALKQVTPKYQELMRSYGMTVCGAAG